MSIIPTQTSFQTTVRFFVAIAILRPPFTRVLLSQQEFHHHLIIRYILSRSMIRDVGFLGSLEQFKAPALYTVWQGRTFLYHFSSVSFAALQAAILFVGAPR